MRSQIGVETTPDELDYDFNQSEDGILPSSIIPGHQI